MRFVIFSADGSLGRTKRGRSHGEAYLKNTSSLRMEMEIALGLFFPTRVNRNLLSKVAPENESLPTRARMEINGSIEGTIPGRVQSRGIPGGRMGTR